MQLEKDPLEHVLRNKASFAILEALHDGIPQSPVEVRHMLEMHPQTLKESIGHLNGYGLLTISIPRGSPMRRTTKGVALPVVLRITAEGQEVLRLARQATDFIQRKVQGREKYLPAATKERWLPA